MINNLTFTESAPEPVLTDKANRLTGDVEVVAGGDERSSIALCAAWTSGE